MKNNGKLLGSIIGIILFIICISSVTYAIYTWATIGSENVEIGATSNCFIVNYVKGRDIGSSEDAELLEPVDSYTKGLSTYLKISVDNKCNIKGNGTLYLETNDNTSDSLIDAGVLYYQVFDVLKKIELSDGAINTKEPIPIYENFEVTSDVIEIMVYVWLNGEYVTNDNLEDVIDQVYQGKVTARVEGR